MFGLSQVSDATSPASPHTQVCQPLFTISLVRPSGTTACCTLGNGVQPGNDVRWRQEGRGVVARWENTHIVRQEENVPPKQALSVPLHYECGGSHAEVWYETAGGKSKLGKWGHTANTGAMEPRVQRPTEGDLGMARVRIIMP